MLELCPKRRLSAFMTKWSHVYKRNGNPWLFPRFGTNQLYDAQQVTRQWGRWQQKLGVPKHRQFQGTPPVTRCARNICKWGCPWMFNWSSRETIQCYSRNRQRSPDGPGHKLVQLTIEERERMINYVTEEPVTANDFDESQFTF